MQVITPTEARKNLFQLLKENKESHEPLLIKGKEADNVLISASDWENIQETLYVTSLPGMVESLKEGRKEALKDCATELDW